MPFVQLSQISLAFGNRDLLKNITLVLTSGSKAALTGANGCGKSTLMKIIAGAIKPDSGEISFEKNTCAAYLPQAGIVHKGRTLLDEAECAFSYGASLVKALEEKGIEMERETDSKKLETLGAEYHTIQVKLEESGWYRRRGSIEEVLRGLGFLPEDFLRNTETFSGGFQMRIALAKILLSNADILILDEPTNYLDIEARNWLEMRLKAFKGGFLLVSHDRYFLDECTSETYELFNGELKKYNCAYTEYEKIRAAELESLTKSYERQQKEIVKTEDFIRKFRYNKSKAAMVQDRVKRLEKIELIEIPEHLKKINFSFPKAPHSGKIVITTTKLTKSYGSKKIFSDLDLLIEKNEKIVIAGRNGAGKTTLLKILALQDSNFLGEVKIGAGVKIGYFSQDASEFIKGEETVIELAEREAPTELFPKLKDMLAAFLFRGDDINKSLSVLSGGEKSRLALLRILLKPFNLLILDEPTNHLDLHSKDVLLDALKSFDGTVIFVSHDQFFIKNLATRVLELKAPNEGRSKKASSVRNFPGSYDYYLYRLKQEEQTTDEISFLKEEPAEKKQGQLFYEEQKKIRSNRRKLEKQEAELLESIDSVENEIALCEKLLAEPEIYTDGIKSKKVQQDIKNLKEKAEELTICWEKLNTLLMEG